MQCRLAPVVIVLVGLLVSGTFVASRSVQAQIAFVSDRDGEPEIYVMNMDGGNMRRLTNNRVDEWRMAWSPGGEQIAFGATRGQMPVIGDVYVMNADGTNVRNLTDRATGDGSPSWSPDGKQIAFASFLDIYVMEPDGTHERSLTNGARISGWPSW